MKIGFPLVLLIISLLVIIASPNFAFSQVNPTTTLSNNVTEGSLEIIGAKIHKPCPLKQTTVKVDISGFAARVNVTQEFENPTSEEIQAIYLFPLSQNSNVDEMTININERIIKGKIQYSKDPQAIYQEAYRNGKVLAFVYQDHPNVFIQSISNIAPRAKIKINLSYIEALKYESSQYEFVFPMVVSRHDISASQNLTNTANAPANVLRDGNNISIEIDLDASMPIESTQSLLHKVELTPITSNKAIIKLKNNDTILNQNFIFKYKVASNQIREGLLTHSSKEGNFFALILQPPEQVTPEQITPKELIFVLDRSSKSKSKLASEKAREVVLLGLNKLYPHDLFNLITFTGKTKTLFPKSVAATPTNLNTAKQSLRFRKGKGATEVIKAIRKALDAPSSEKHLKVVCFITDRYINDEQEIIRQVQKHPNTRVFTFGIDRFVNHYLLDKMALYSRGEAEYLSFKDDSLAVAKRFNEKIYNPLLTNISINWANLPVSDIYPKQILDLFSAKPIVLFGRYNGEASAVIQLKGELAGKQITKEIPIQLSTKEQNQSIAQLWASAQVTDLINDIALTHHKVSLFPLQPEVLKNKNEQITQLGLKYNLLTDTTSFVAVEENPSTEPTLVSPTYSPLQYADIFDSRSSVGCIGYGYGWQRQINIDTPNISTSYDSSYIERLPSSATGNSQTSLALLNPGVIDKGSNLFVNGQQNNNLQIDGIDSNNPQVSSSLISKEAIQEVNIITSNYLAALGNTNGGLISVTAKSGNNQFHGTVYENNRVSALAANDFDNNAQYSKVEKGTFTRNEFGVSIGGPIKKDNTFIFHNSEFTYIRSNSPNIFIVPTQDLLNLSSKQTQDFFKALPLSTAINGQVFTVRQITSKIPSLKPNNLFAQLPKGLPAFGQVITRLSTDNGAGLPQNSYRSATRFDQQVTDRIHFYIRHLVAKENLFASTISASPYKGFNTGQKNLANNLLLAVNIVATPRLVLGSRLGFSRLSKEPILDQQTFTPTLLATTNIPDIAGHPLTLPGFQPSKPFGYQSQSNSIPVSGATNQYQLVQKMVWVVNKHTFEFGADYKRFQDNRTIDFSSAKTQTLGANLAQALDNLLKGQVNSLQLAIDLSKQTQRDLSLAEVSKASRAYRSNQFSFYAQDSFRASSYLIFNFGVHYDYFSVPSNKDKQLALNFYYGKGDNLAEKIRNGQLLTAANSSIKSIYQKDKNNFAPQLGLAWDISKRGKTSLRLGYSLSYIPVSGNDIFKLSQNASNSAIVSLNAGVEMAHLPLSINSLSLLNSNLLRANLNHIDENLTTAYSHNYSVSLEQELTNKSLVFIDYVGTKGVNLYSLANFNRPGYGKFFFSDKESTSRLNNQFANIFTLSNQAKSSYHRLTVGYNKRSWSQVGLLLNAHYSWSHAIDNLDTTSNGFTKGFLDPFNPNLDKGSADVDTRHKFVFNGVWTLPFFSRIYGVRRALFSGYELSYLFTASSGTPFSIYDCSNSLGIGCARLSLATKLNKTAKNLSATNEPNVFNYLDLSNQASLIGNYQSPVLGFSDIGTYPSNMTGRNIFSSPSKWQVDLALVKRISLNDRCKLNLRLEAYNLFNHSNLEVLTSQTDASQTSFIKAKRFGHRQTQLAAKFTF